MFNKMKWRPAVYSVCALGIIGLAAYGITHTVNAFKDINQSVAAEYINTSSDNGNDLTSEGCNPYGCAACAACTKVQYQQNVENLSGSTTQITQSLSEI